MESVSVTTTVLIHGRDAPKPTGMSTRKLKLAPKCERRPSGAKGVYSGAKGVYSGAKGVYSGAKGV